MAFVASLDESSSLMQDRPNYAAEPMGNCPNGGLVAQSRQQPPEHRLKTGSISLIDDIRFCFDASSARTRFAKVQVGSEGDEEFSDSPRRRS